MEGTDYKGKRDDKDSIGQQLTKHKTERNGTVTQPVSESGVTINTANRAKISQVLVFL